MAGGVRSKGRGSSNNGTVLNADEWGVRVKVLTQATGNMAPMTQVNRQGCYGGIVSLLQWDNEAGLDP